MIPTENFSAKSFAFHDTSVKKEQLQEIHLLPKIINVLFFDTYNLKKRMKIFLYWKVIEVYLQYIVN